MKMNCLEKWNSCILPRPQPFTISTPLNISIKRKLTAIRSGLNDLREVLDLRCLHVEAGILSRFLYRNYRKLSKDKGFQLLKMVMSSLNKYLRMKVIDEIDEMRDVVPPNFSPLSTEYCLPTREAFGWLLARIQATIALFYRIFQLCKRAGRQLYGRLRLRWNPPILLFGLGLTARIYVVARYMVQKLVASYDTLVPFVRVLSTLKTAENEFFKDYPRDIRAYFGGMDDVMKAAKLVNNTVDMTMQLIDLTEDPETEQREFIDTLNNIQGGDEDEEVQRICEIVNLDATNRKADAVAAAAAAQVMEVVALDEDIGEPVAWFQSREPNQGVIELSTSDYGQSAHGKRRALKTPVKKRNLNKKAKLMETIDLAGSDQSFVNSSVKKRQKNRSQKRKSK